MTKKQEILVEWMNGAACSKHKNFSGPITCDVCLLGSFGEIFLSHALDTYLEQAFREIRPEDVLLHIDEPLGDNIGVPEEWGTGYNTALSDLDTNYKRFKGDQT